MPVEELARILVRNIREFHADALASGDMDDERFKAVVVKCVALCVLTYGIPAEGDGLPDFNEAMQKLAWANSVLLPQEADEDLPEEEP
jgi:hypothetical protein